jgi:hypothetical protein
MNTPTDIEKMEQQLQENPETYKAFKALITLLARKNLTDKEKQQTIVLESMQRSGCQGNPEKTENYITHQYFLAERVPPLFQPRRGYGVSW